MNGNFHSTDHCGIITYLNQYRPGLKIGTVEVIRQENTQAHLKHSVRPIFHLRTQRHDLYVLITNKRGDDFPYRPLFFRRAGLFGSSERYFMRTGLPFWRSPPPGRDRSENMIGFRYHSR